MTFQARRGLLVKVIYGPGQRAPPAKGRDNLTGPTSPSGSGTVADDFRVYASETVTTRPGSVPPLIFGADGHGTFGDRGVGTCWDLSGQRGLSLRRPPLLNGR